MIKGVSGQASRRRFLWDGLSAMMATIVAAMAWPVVHYIISPALNGQMAEIWDDVGPIDKVGIGKPEQLTYKVVVQDGYLTREVTRSVWVVRQDEQVVMAFNPNCTHLGCGYHWDLEAKAFMCPCHDSVFDIGGNVLGGPAPRPLDALKTKVEKGELFVAYETFRAGISEKLPT